MGVGLGKTLYRCGKSENMVHSNSLQMHDLSFFVFPSPVNVDNHCWKLSFLEWMFCSFMDKGHGWSLYRKWWDVDGRDGTLQGLVKEIVIYSNRKTKRTHSWKDSWVDNGHRKDSLRKTVNRWAFHYLFVIFAEFSLAGRTFPYVCACVFQVRTWFLS